ncbi:hypothetical protein E3Q19_00730 [Wallemia mellicola]|nr:hypothetical protein E3Q19_00730 [Wallemia mellicola]TIC30604.1 hypothetical protein E3Q11_00857 [Wallemia mellicola]TIC75557.1 hypothetical protein E3Q00_00723 [Wallemia mellicola]
MDQEEVIFAARLNEREELEDFINEYGLDAVLNARDERSNSILHMLSANNHYELLKAVIKFEDDAFIEKYSSLLENTLLHQNESKSTALHWASTNGNKEVAIFLCDLSKKLKGEVEHKLTFSTNQSGQSAASEAERGGHDDLVVELLARMDALDNGTQKQENEKEESQGDANGEDTEDVVLKVAEIDSRCSSLRLIHPWIYTLRSACDNCHKNKRRCDGFLPCSNCDFSGKQCSYSDNNGHAIPPPKSRSEKEHESHLKLKTEYNLFTSDSHGENSRALLNDPILKKELVILFLDHMYPFNLMFHKPSLLYALEKDRLSPMLLNSIFGLSARLSPHPKFQQIEAWRTGVDFAAIARRILLVPNELGSCALDEPKLEVIQTAVLLAAHDFGVGFFNRAYTYLGMAISQLKTLGLNHDDFVLPAPEDTREKWIGREERRRTAWCVIMLDSIAAAINGRAKPFEEHDLKVFLPADDVAFELAVGNTSNREFINSTPSNDQSTTEFGYLIRIVNIFSNVMGYIYFHEKERMANSSDRSTMSSKTNTESPYSSQACKHALAQWSQSLPHHLELSSINLNLAVMSMQAGANSSGWCYALMHAFAECSVFYLHSTAESNTTEEAVRSSADRQNQSVGNMRAIIDALTITGRKSPLLIYFVYVISKWQLHVQGALDASIADIWDDEIADLWHIDKSILTGGNPPPVLEEVASEDSDNIEEQPAPANTMDTIANILENATNTTVNLNTSVNPLDLDLLPSRDTFLSPSFPDIFVPPINGIANASPTPNTPPVRMATLRSSSDLANFAVGCDADIGGKSEAILDYIPQSSGAGDEHGHGKFRGVLNPFVPESWKKTLEDGQTAKSGYAGFRTKTRTTLFGTACWDLSLHPYLAMRVRNNFKGDSKSGFFINIQTEGAVRTDLFQHRLHIFGNDWQTLVVPLSSFVLTNAGETSDQQLPMLREKIRTVGLSLLAKPDGDKLGRVENTQENFDLDIEWIEGWNDAENGHKNDNQIDEKAGNL